MSLKVTTDDSVVATAPWVTLALGKDHGLELLNAKSATLLATVVLVNTTWSLATALELKPVKAPENDPLAELPEVSPALSPAKAVATSCAELATDAV